MKPLTARKQERLESKKKKLAALAGLVQLNDEDRLDTVKSKTKIRIMQREHPLPTTTDETSESLSPSSDLPPSTTQTPTPISEMPIKSDEIEEESISNATCNDMDIGSNDDGFKIVSYKKKSLKTKLTGDESPKKRLKNNHSDTNDGDNTIINVNKFSSLGDIVADHETTIEDDIDDDEEDGNNDEVDTIKLPESLLDMKVTLTEAQYKVVKRQLRERKRQLENVPSIRLREVGFRASLAVPQDQRTPIFLTDIQHLLMSALIGKKSPCAPDRWCLLDKSIKLTHSVVLILEGLSLYHYISNESKFQNTNKIFDTRLEVVLPPSQDGKIINEIAQVPLTNLQAQELIEKHGSLETAVEMNKDPTLFVKSIFPMIDDEISQPTTPNIEDLPPTDKFPRTKLLLSALQMVDEGYPMPLRGQLQQRFKDYIFTKTQYAPVNDHSPMFGVDCEMCRTSVGLNELTRISIVNEDLETIYETLVRPTNRIIDYLTRYSGITPELMKTVTKTLNEVQKEVAELLPPDAILVGQSLNTDLNAMRMMHPYVIDTSVIFNLSGVRRRKSKLQTLARTFLKELIQENDFGHDSVEDSLASLKLVKMKLANSMEFGDEILIQKKRFHEIIRSTVSDKIRNNLFAHAAKREKRTALITCGLMQEPLKNVIKRANCIVAKEEQVTVSMYELDSNKEAVKKARDVALENSLTITNLNMQAEVLYPEVIEQTIQKVDKWIGKLWKAIAHNGMLLVLMGGNSECPSGVAKIAIKSNIADIAAEVPISL